MDKANWGILALAIAMALGCILATLLSSWGCEASPRRAPADARRKVVKVLGGPVHRVAGEPVGRGGERDDPVLERRAGARPVVLQRPSMRAVHEQGEGRLLLHVRQAEPRPRTDAEERVQGRIEKGPGRRGVVEERLS